MAVLVTGGTGFLGSYVLESLLKTQEDVVCLSRDNPVRPLRLEGNLTMLSGDIMEKDNLDRAIKEHGVSQLIHLAGMLSWASQKDPPSATRINCVGTMNVLEAASSGGVKRVVFASSVQVYGSGAVAGRKVDEETPTDPSSVYGATKLFAERLGANYAKLYGLEFIVTRLSACFGYGNVLSKKDPTESRVEKIQRLVEFPLAGRAVEIGGDATELMDYVYVEDAAATIVNAALKKGLNHWVYLVSSGKLHSIRDFERAVRRHVPNAEIVLTGRSDSLYPSSGPYDPRRAKIELSHRPRRFSEAIEEYVRIARGTLNRYV